MIVCDTGPLVAAAISDDAWTLDTHVWRAYHYAGKGFLIETRQERDEHHEYWVERHVQHGDDVAEQEHD